MSLKLKLLLWAHNTFNKFDLVGAKPAAFRAFADNRDSYFTMPGFSKKCLAAYHEIAKVLDTVLKKEKELS